MRRQYRLPHGEKVFAGKQFTANDGTTYPANWFDHATQQDLTDHGITFEMVADAPADETKIEQPAPASPVAAPPVEKKALSFHGVDYVAPDMMKLALDVAVASNAIQHGIQANDFRWCDAAKDYTMSAADGTPVPMDAPTLIQFALAVRKL